LTAFSFFPDVPIVLAAIVVAIAAWKGIKIIIIHRKENGDS
jgi:hypothetical protein